MSRFKRIDNSHFSTNEQVIYPKVNLDSGSEGIENIGVVSGSINNNYWQSLHYMFYLSGSPVVSASDPYGYDKYESPLYSFGYFEKQHRNKFHGYPSSSIITIPQKYFGEKIKKNSFNLTFTTMSKQIKITDDGFGNLYSTNAEHSQSINHASHSDNYVGNIFYELGLAVLTETGSWSGSVNYPDAATGSDVDYSLNFAGTQTLFTTEYDVTIAPNEFNTSMNRTCWSTISQSSGKKPSILHGQFVRLNDRFTGSDARGDRVWNPYITQIHLWGDDDIKSATFPYIPDPDNPGKQILAKPLVVANVPRPIKVSRDVPITIKIKLDT